MPDVSDAAIADMRIEVVKREINQGALAGFDSIVTDQAAALVIAALDSYDASVPATAYREGFEAAEVNQELLLAAAHEEGRQQGRAEYAELVAAARALVDGLGLVRGQSFTATEPVVRLLRAVRGLEAQTKPAEVRDGTA